MSAVSYGCVTDEMESKIELEDSYFIFVGSFKYWSVFCKCGVCWGYSVRTGG